MLVGDEDEVSVAWWLRIQEEWLLMKVEGMQLGDWGWRESCFVMKKMEWTLLAGEDEMNVAC